MIDMKKLDVLQMKRCWLKLKQADKRKITFIGVASNTTT
jgi:hypothetical protein